MRAVTAKTAESLPHGVATGLKHDDYPAGYGGSSALLDTYLQYIGENMIGTYNLNESRTIARASWQD